MPLVCETVIGAICDKCGKEALHAHSFMYTTGGKKAATDYARTAGFSVGKNGVLCPECRSKKGGE